MENRYNDQEAREFITAHPDISGELALRVYTSRLIGDQPDLVLHGGGNTSVKVKMRNILGDEEEILFVKGSGHDLKAIGSDGFAGLELASLKRLKRLETVTDAEMENQLSMRRINAHSPLPSVEALVHAFLPHKFIDHTHADSILVLTNQKNGADLIREALGPHVSILPYFMSGMPLAKAIAALYEKNPEAEAIVILNHGIFTFHDEASISYERMIDCVSRAESYIRRKTDSARSKRISTESRIPGDAERSAARLAQVIRGACAHPDKQIDPQGRLRRFYAEIRTTPEIIGATLSPHAREIAASGVLTPDHVTRTKNAALFLDRIPESDDELKNMAADMLGAYEKEYDQYVSRQSKAKGRTVERLDAFPRVFLVAGVGMIALGFSRNAAKVAADIAEHTIHAKLLASDMGAYMPIDESHVFDMEYWALQQKKMTPSQTMPLQGQVAVVTGAGGAIGFGIADRLMAAGAVVILSDIDEPRLNKVAAILAERYGQNQVEAMPFDVADFHSVENAFEKICGRVGGIDILIPNAGVAHVSKIETLDPEKFTQVTAVNLMGTFHVIKAAIPVFRRQGTGGNIVVISSKNVYDPGAAFGAYSASKAGAHQLARIASLELAELGVRVNMINPDAVFGDEEISSKLWDLIGPARMKSRGLDPQGLKEYYRERNLLKVSVRPEHVGNAVVFFASEQTPTTGATLPVDGGIPAASPR